MKYLIKILFASFFILLSMKGMAINKDSLLFTRIDLKHPGLKKVRRFVNQKDYTSASKALLKYFKGRTGERLPKYNKGDRFKFQDKPIPKGIKEKADSGLAHIFYVHKGYGYNGDGFLHYGKDINWQYWPVKDNEIRWQVNRMYWWIPMGRAYWATGNEKYAKEWISQYKDWVKKNPLGLSKENDRFAWRPLETSRRIQDQTALFNFFINSSHFTPDFLILFLNNYYNHIEHVIKNYSEKGNHLLFEAQRILYGACFFPEFKKSSNWRQSGVQVLTQGIKKQVYSDGLQYELSPNYHIAAINIFLKALRVMQLNGFDHEFPKSYPKTIENMIMAVINFSFPDYTYPMFSDAKLPHRKSMIKKYKSWFKAFPKNKVIEYYATNGHKGHQPDYLSKGLKKGGFYTFRNGWNDSSTVMVLKASPPGFWHAQPDNGTFNLWSHGRNFTPDAGSYVYGGNEEVLKLRNWYRQTRVHQTLTLNNKNQDSTDAQLLKWETSDSLDILIYSNPSYKRLRHQRTILFINKTFFVILDQAIGEAKGDIEIHFQLAPESQPTFIAKKNRIFTQYKDGNNLLIQNISEKKPKFITEAGKVSYSYRESEDRPAFAFTKEKKKESSIRFLTILYPFSDNKAPNIQLIKGPTKKELTQGKLRIKISIDKRPYNISLNFTPKL